MLCASWVSYVSYVRRKSAAVCAAFASCFLWELLIWIGLCVLQAPEKAEKKAPAKEVEKPKADGVKACL